MPEALRIDHLRKTYGETVAVDDISLSVQEGRIYGLVGPNGSGKTTTLSCALGLLRPDSGELRVLAQPPGRLAETKGALGVVFDDPVLLPGLSLRANLGYARRLLGHSGGRSDAEVLELVGMQGVPANRRAHGLSLGQGRRVAIARALLGKPRLLVLDEPLSGLDTVGVREMLRLFKRLRSEGITLLLSSHRLHELETIADDIAILLSGRVVREAPLPELLGEQARRLELRASPPAQALAALEALQGIGSVVALNDDRLRVDLGTREPEELARALHEAGCALHALVPERSSLQAVFEALLDEQLVGTTPGEAQA
ncbi:MAG: multidrug ABC transporter ATP-binding protein [Planctomycetota bacterium]|nr:MAG: multidrug ABC transporter ATP-binding protein [Planctomycetota bacterium]